MVRNERQFARKLRRTRLKLRKTQEQFASEAGLGSQKILSEIELGRRLPTASERDSIATYLDELGEESSWVKQSTIKRELYSRRRRAAAADVFLEDQTNWLADNAGQYEAWWFNAHNSRLFSVSDHAIIKAWSKAIVLSGIPVNIPIDLSRSGEEGDFPVRRLFARALKLAGSCALLAEGNEVTPSKKIFLRFFRYHGESNEAALRSMPEQGLPTIEEIPDRESRWLDLSEMLDLSKIQELAPSGWRALVQGASVGCSLLLYVPTKIWSTNPPVAVLDPGRTINGFDDVDHTGQGPIFLSTSTASKLADMARPLKTAWDIAAKTRRAGEFKEQTGGIATKDG